MMLTRSGYSKLCRADVAFVRFAGKPITGHIRRSLSIIRRYTLKKAHNGES